ncbi:hypothetical protein MTBBW1_990008 [Desulfamplus magnetovallimortis]|uniref:Uncharacterized protein n=1 Tax=Desulfamplus magnetovallimortis TaxID=1246637 RepID=A0A1W1HLD6_9BACT|nr:hypothetical protein [Desulfamplus magnetovallimortis]SLM33279.1 hypothetical protein MTBBW1_990008 [Desulfamplus magnetovallimortis]
MIKNIKSDKQSFLPSADLDHKNGDGCFHGQSSGDVTMRAIFFPFTFLNKNESALLSSLFQKSTFLSIQSEKERADSCARSSESHGESDDFALSGIKEGDASSNCDISLNKQNPARTMDRSVLTPVIFSDDEILPVIKSVASYREWAQLNQGTGKGYLKSVLRESPYFTSDTDISSIRCQITKGIKGNAQGGIVPDFLSSTSGSSGSANSFSSAESSWPEQANQENDDKLFRSLLFLRLAQISDQEQEEIDTKMLSLDNCERLLFTQLKGGDFQEQDDDPFTGDEFFHGNLSFHDSTATPDHKNYDGYSKGKGTYSDRGRFMTEQRMIAWSTAMKSRFEPEGEYLFITSSPAVLDFIISVAEKSKLMLDINNFKVQKETCSHKDQWQKDFCGAVETLIHGGHWNMVNSIPEDDCCAICVDVRLFLLSGEHVERLLCLSRRKDSDSELFRNSGKMIPVLLVALKNKMLDLIFNLL